MDYLADNNNVTEGKFVEDMYILSRLDNFFTYNGLTFHLRFANFFYDNCEFDCMKNAGCSIFFKCFLFYGR